MGKRFFAAAVSIFLLIAGLSCTANAYGANWGISLGDADVTCEVPPKYDFTVPEDVVIQYPQTRRYLGAFGIGDILLRSGETLNVIVTMGSLVKNGTGGGVLPYTIIFNAPSDFDGAFVGTSYDMTIEIDDEDFRNASVGTYTGHLLFQVESNRDNQVVWQQTVLVSAIRTSPTVTSNPQTGETQPDETVQPSEGDDLIDTLPLDEEPCQTLLGAADTDSYDAPEIPGNVEDKRVLPEFEKLSQYWFLIPIILAVIFFGVLLVILLKKKRRNELKKD